MFSPISDWISLISLEIRLALWMYNAVYIFPNQDQHSMSKCLQVRNLVLFLNESKFVEDINSKICLFHLIDTLVPTDFYNYILEFIINAAKMMVSFKIH